MRPVPKITDSNTLIASFVISITETEKGHIYAKSLQKGISCTRLLAFIRARNEKSRVCSYPSLISVCLMIMYPSQKRQIYTRTARIRVGSECLGAIVFYGKISHHIPYLKAFSRVRALYYCVFRHRSRAAAPRDYIIAGLFTSPAVILFRSATVNLS